MPQGQYKLSDAKPIGAYSLADATPVEAPAPAAQTEAADPSSWAQTLGRAVLGSLGGDNAELRDAVGNGVIGILKGAGHTAESLGQLIHKLPGVSTAVDAAYGKPGLSKSAFAAADEDLAPQGTAQKVGYGVEQAGEFMVPGGAAERGAASVAAKAAPVFANSPRLVQAAARVAPRMATQSLAAAGTATAQGADPTVAAVAGAASPVIAEAGAATAPYLKAKAEALTRAAVKPTVAAMRRIAGASMTGLDAQANKLVRFVLDNGVTTPDKARAIVADAEKELQTLIQTKNVPTDAPQRAVRYLSALEKSAARQGLPAQDVATIRNAAAEVLESGLGKDVVTMVPAPHPTLVGPNGQPITVLQPQVSRQLRTDVMADEALDRARATSQWDTRKSYGEQKGAAKEASKAVERAERDSVKVAIPEARPILARQSQAITATDALDRMSFRAANRDALSLPGVVGAAPEMAAGKFPILGIAAHWLRNNQLRAGVWADRLSKAIANQDVQEVGAILNRFGVGVTAQQGR